MKKPKTLTVTVEKIGKTWLASMGEASVSTVADNPYEALMDLLFIAQDTYDSFEGIPSKQLGPQPKHDRKVLKTFLYG